jgi:hypothetical protein
MVQDSVFGASACINIGLLMSMRTFVHSVAPGISKCTSSSTHPSAVQFTELFARRTPSQRLYKNRKRVVKCSSYGREYVVAVEADVVQFLPLLAVFLQSF